MDELDVPVVALLEVAIELDVAETDEELDDDAPEVELDAEVAPVVATFVLDAETEDPPPPEFAPPEEPIPP